MVLKDIKLGECLSMIENGATIKQKEGAGGYPITRIETLSNDRFNRDRLGYADINNIELFKNHILDDEDLIMSHINSRQFLGRTVIYLKKGSETIIHGMNVLRIKTKRDLLNPYYAYYYFKTPHFRKAIDNIRTDAINQSSINTNNIKDIKIHIPDLVSQEKVVGILRGLDKKIEENEVMNAELEAMAKQLYDYWFVQFDFPDENGNPYKSSGGKMVYNPTLKREIPEGWEVKSLRDLLILEDSRRIPLSNKEREGRHGIYPYYGATGIMDYVDDYIFEGDYILLAEDGSTSDGNGNPVVQYIWGKNWVNNHAHIIHVKDDTHLQYYYFLLKTIPVVLIETGSIQKKISQENLLAYSVACPINKLISEYSSISSSLRKKQKKLMDETNYLTHLRDSLLPMLMNGQVTVE